MITAWIHATTTEPNRPPPVEVPESDIPPEQIPGRSFISLLSMPLTLILALAMNIVVLRKTLGGHTVEYSDTTELRPD
jgi:hypothetical protein